MLLLSFILLLLLFKDFENNVKLLRGVLMAALKRRKAQLTCELCGITKRSANGFISHLQFCGKTEEVLSITAL